MSCHIVLDPFLLRKLPFLPSSASSFHHAILKAAASYFLSHIKNLVSDLLLSRLTMFGSESLTYATLLAGRARFALAGVLC